MGWEWRGRNRYFYSRHNNGSTVKKLYIGRGARAEEIAQQRAVLRAMQEDQRNCLKAIQKSYGVVASLLSDFSRETEALTKLALNAAGYQQHNRGEWRRRRGQKKEA
jgi:hypothetical protein